ncbi:MAG: Nramp family divalent metal transporter [Planctomycetaceae bacterium]|nr:Nramp family divalent metal transporter [Planctomycetaceae bacterium]
MTTTQITIPPPDGICAEPFSVRKCVRLLGSFGPAAVVASLSLGAGETIMVCGLGSWSEFGLLWMLVLSVVTRALVVMYLVGRYTAVTGQPFAQRVALLPGPRGWVLLLFVLGELAVISTGLTAIAKPCGNLGVFLLSEKLGLADTLGLTNPDTARLWVNGITSVFLGAALAVGLGSSYASLEKQQIVICGLMVAGTAAATLVVGPNLIELLKGAVSFGQLPPAPEWAPPAAQNDYGLNLATIFGYVGGSLSGYIAYSSWVGLHGWGLAGNAAARKASAGMTNAKHLPDDPVQAGFLRRSMTPLRWDVALGALVLLAVTAAFLSAGATVLYPRHLSPGAGEEFSLLTKQAVIWEQISPWLVPVYYIAVLLALWGTIASVPEAVARVAYDLITAARPAASQIPFRTVLTVLVVWFFISGQFWNWGNFRFDLLTQIGALVTVNLGVGVVCLLATYYNATLPPRYRAPWWLTLAGVVSGALFLVAFVVTAAGMWAKVVGSG